MTGARPEDVDAIAGALPGTELSTSWGDRPTWKVDGKGFLLYRAPHKTALDPATGAPFEDLLVVTVADLGAKAALVEADNPFFDIDHFNGYPAVLVQTSRLGEIDRDELAEIITEAWACKAPKKLVREYFGEPADPFEDLPAPARRALAAAGITTRDQVDAMADKDLLTLHGIGPKALRLIRGAGA